MDGRGHRPQRRPEAETKPAKTPHLHVRSVEGLLSEEAIAITGNARALLQLRDQIDRALEDEGSHPFEEGVYRDVDGIESEVAIKRARTRGEMREPMSKPQRTAEELPWAGRARRTSEEDRAERDEE